MRLQGLRNKLRGAYDDARSNSDLNEFIQFHVDGNGWLIWVQERKYGRFDVEVQGSCETMRDYDNLEDWLDQVITDIDDTWFAEHASEYEIDDETGEYSWVDDNEGIAASMGFSY